MRTDSILRRENLFFNIFRKAYRLENKDIKFIERGFSKYPYKF